MVMCYMVGCGVKSGVKSPANGLAKFFRIPRVITNQCDKTRRLSDQRRTLWIARINREDLRENDVQDYTRVCNRHFLREKPSALFDDTNPDWAPCINLGYKKKDTSASSAQRYERVVQRRQNCLLLNTDSNEHGSPARLLQNNAENGECELQEENVNIEEADVEAENEQFELPEVIANIQEEELQIEDQWFELPPGSVIIAEAEQETENALRDPTSKDSESEGHLPSNKVLKLQDEVISLKAQLGAEDTKVCQQQEEINKLKTELKTVVVRNYHLQKEVSLLKSRLELQDKKHEEEINQLAQGHDQLKVELKGMDELTSQQQKNIDFLSKDNISLRASVKKLSDELGCLHLDEVSLSKDNNKVKFYTGLASFTLLMHIFKLVNEYMDLNGRGVPTFRQFLIVLMRLRLNLFEKDLAYRFGIHQSTASKILTKWIPVISACLEKAIIWPDRETLQKTMPESFQVNFGKKVAVIIDCFEVFIDRCTSLNPRAGTWSQYKHHNTVKFLIGITPQGTISFISNAWVGRCSDKHITEHSGLLDKLLPNDIVLADRGFDISDSVGLVGAYLKMPAFTGGKPQLSYEDVELTRKIANVRIHVERVIGLVRRKYTILSSTLPIATVTSDNEIPLIDHIVKICCALVNLSPPIVSLGNDEL